jgi:hypothetical protein
VRTHRVLSISGLCSVLSACSLLIDADKAELATRTGSADGSDAGDESPVPGTPCEDDADCSDGDPCSGTERCDPDDASGDARGCVAGAPLDCSDDVACTEDRCVSGEGCQHKPNSTRCDDGIDCTVDVCSLGEGCHNDPNQARCDFCQPGSECSPERGCVGGIPNRCSDGDSCTTDQCDATTLQCQHFGSCEGGPDDCASAEEILLADGSGIVGGSFERVTHQYGTGCGDEAGSDAVYRVRIDEISDIVLDTTASGARTTVAVGKGCTGDFELACAGERSGGERGGRLVIHRYDPAVLGSDLFVLIDALSAGETGDYVLTVEVTPVAADRCDNSNVTLPVGATLLGFMDALEPANAWGEQQGTCQLGLGSGPAPEALVSFVADDDDRFRFTVSSTEFSPSFYARRSCAGRRPQDELACQSPLFGESEAELEVELTQGDEAFLFVDGGRDRASYVIRSFP